MKYSKEQDVSTIDIRSHALLCGRYLVKFGCSFHGLLADIMAWRLEGAPWVTNGSLHALRQPAVHQQTRF